MDMGVAGDAPRGLMPGGGKNMGGAAALLPRMLLLLLARCRLRPCRRRFRHPTPASRQARAVSQLLRLRPRRRRIVHAHLHEGHDGRRPGQRRRGGGVSEPEHLERAGAARQDARIVAIKIQSGLGPSGRSDRAMQQPALDYLLANWRRWRKRRRCWPSIPRARRCRPARPPRSGSSRPMSTLPAPWRRRWRCSRRRGRS